jgi:hypothetical protein
MVRQQLRLDCEPAALESAAGRLDGAPRVFSPEYLKRHAVHMHERRDPRYGIADTKPARRSDPTEGQRPLRHRCCRDSRAICVVLFRRER